MRNRSPGCVPGLTDSSFTPVSVETLHTIKTTLSNLQQSSCLIDITVQVAMFKFCSPQEQAPNDVLDDD